MATAAISGYQTWFQIGDGAAPENFTTIAEIKDGTPPQSERDEADVTTHDSAGHAKESIPTFIDNGEVSLVINWIPADATHLKLRMDFLSGVMRNFKVIYPDVGTMTDTFTAFVKAVKPATPLNDVLAQEIALRISGQVTRTA